MLSMKDKFNSLNRQKVSEKMITDNKGFVKDRDYYSDVYFPEDDDVVIKCDKCNKEFISGDMLLKIPENEEYTDDDLTEHCPYCKSKFEESQLS